MGTHSQLLWSRKRRLTLTSRSTVQLLWKGESRLCRYQVKTKRVQSSTKKPWWCRDLLRRRWISPNQGEGKEVHSFPCHEQGQRVVRAVQHHVNVHHFTHLH